MKSFRSSSRADAGRFPWRTHGAPWTAGAWGFAAGTRQTLIVTLRGTQITRRAGKPGSGARRWWHCVTCFAPCPRAPSSTTGCPPAFPARVSARHGHACGFLCLLGPPTPPVLAKPSRSSGRAQGRPQSLPKSLPSSACPAAS